MFLLLSQLCSLSSSPDFPERSPRWANIQLESAEWCCDRRTNSTSLMLSYLLQADLRLIFPSARWILARLPSISICTKVKSLWDLGLNIGCLATAPSNPPLKPHLFLSRQLAVGMRASDGNVGGGESGPVRQQNPRPWFGASSVIKSSPVCLTWWP